MSLLSVVAAVAIAATTIICFPPHPHYYVSFFFLYCSRSYSGYLSHLLEFAAVPIFRSLTLAIIKIGREVRPLFHAVEPLFKDVPLRSRRLRMINTYRKILQWCRANTSSIFRSLKSARERFDDEHGRIVKCISRDTERAHGNSRL